MTVPQRATLPSSGRPSTLGSTMRRLLLAAILALTLSASAAAATLDDLRAAGYTVAKASDCHAGVDDKGAPVWKTTWHVSGFGNSTYMSECDPGFQAAVDSWADPAVNYERRWQHEHPDQLAAANAIADKCYSIGRTAPATDSWKILGAAGVNLTVTGAELPGLAATLPDARAVDGSCNATVAIVPSGSGSTVTVPGAVPIAAPVSPLAPSAQEQAALAETIAEVQELVDTFEGTGSITESLRLANAVLDS